jgi:hypothetical protein
MLFSMWEGGFLYAFAKRRTLPWAGSDRSLSGQIEFIKANSRQPFPDGFLATVTFEDPFLE